MSIESTWRDATTGRQHEGHIEGNWEGDWTVTTIQEHVYIHGGPEGEDEVFDSWVEWFRGKGIPHVVTESVTEDGLPRRTLL